MRLLIFFIVLLSLPVSAFPQSIEIFVMTGAVQVWDDEGSLGWGAPIGGGVGFRSPHGWGLEALVESQRVKRRFASDVRFDSTVLGSRARLLKYFRDGRTQPYAGAGLGLTRIKSAYDYPADCALTTNNQFRCTSRDVTHRTSTSGTLSGFAGVRIAAGRRLFLRPEFELSRAGEHLRMGGTIVIGGAW